MSCDPHVTVMWSSGGWGTYLRRLTRTVMGHWMWRKFCEWCRNSTLAFHTKCSNKSSRWVMWQSCDGHVMLIRSVSGCWELHVASTGYEELPYNTGSSLVGEEEEGGTREGRGRGRREGREGEGEMNERNDILLWVCACVIVVTQELPLLIMTLSVWLKPNTDLAAVRPDCMSRKLHVVYYHNTIVPTSEQTNTTTEQVLLLYMYRYITQGINLHVAPGKQKIIIILCITWLVLVKLEGDKISYVHLLSWP